MQSTPILTVQSANALLDVLEDFLDKSEASFAMVIERGGWGPFESDVNHARGFILVRPRLPCLEKLV